MKSRLQHRPAREPLQGVREVSGHEGGGGGVVVGEVMNETSLDPRPVSASVTTMTEFVLPTHANALGSVFGGQIMAWMDLCGAICAQRHTGRVVITAGVDELSFERPIKVGEGVRVSARGAGAVPASLG